jgi:hypothetical protein
MIDSWSVRLLRRWVAFYTRGLSDDVGGRRREEIEADLWSQFEEATLIGRDERSTSAEVLVRLLAGLPADISWRLAHSGADPVPSSLPRVVTSGIRAIGVFSIVGGLGLATQLGMYAAVPNPWAVPGVWPLMALAMVGGDVALALAIVGLVIRFQDRLRGPVAFLGSIGFLGALLSAVGGYVLIGLLPVGSAAVVWDLGLARVMDRRLAIVHIVSAIAFVSVVAVTLTGTAIASAPVLFLVLFLYAFTWVAIGVAMLRGVPAEAPAPGGE